MLTVVFLATHHFISISLRVSLNGFLAHERIVDLRTFLSLVEADLEVARAAISIDTPANQTIHVEFGGDKVGTLRDFIVRAETSYIHVHVMLLTTHAHHQGEWEDGRPIIIDLEEVLIVVVRVEVDITDFVAA